MNTLLLCLLANSESGTVYFHGQSMGMVKWRCHHLGHLLPTLDEGAAKRQNELGVIGSKSVAGRILMLRDCCGFTSIANVRAFSMMTWQHAQQVHGNVWIAMDRSSAVRFDAL